MFGMFEINVGILWSFSLKGSPVSDIYCCKKDDNAHCEAVKALNNNNFLSRSSNLFGTVVSRMKKCRDHVELGEDKPDTMMTLHLRNKLNESGVYFTNFLAHAIYIMVVKIDHITIKEELSNVFKMLEKYSINLELMGIRKKDIVCSVNIVQSEIYNVLTKDVSCYISRFSNVGDCFLEEGSCKIKKKDLYEKSFDGLNNALMRANTLLTNMQLVSKILCAACKIYELQKDPVLLKRVFNLYNEIACFLKEEDRLDKATQVEINELVARAETSDWVKDTAQTMKKMAGADISTLTQSEIDLLRGGCGELQKSLDRVNSVRSDEVSVEGISQQLVNLQRMLEQLKLQKESKVSTQSEVRDPQFSSSLCCASEIDNDVNMSANS